MLFRLCLSIISVLVLCSQYVISAGNSVTALDRPYDIIWQSPSVNCLNKYDVTFVEALTNARLTFNNDDRWHGERSVIYNPFNYGSWPYYKNGEPPALNGGIPQLGNLSLHLANVRAAIELSIPDNTFDGIAVIDMEEWRPLWIWNFGWKTIYQTESVALVKKIHKKNNPTDDWVEEEADREFNEASRKFMTETLRTSIQQRPKGLWGYYHYPECFNNNKPFVLHCKKVVQDGNDELKWLWEESTALYPSLYIFKDTWSENDAARYMYAILDETVRVSNLVGGRPIIPYTKLKHNMMKSESFYRKSIMLMSLRIGADFGTEGIVIWNSDRDYEIIDGCYQNLEYLNNIVSPYSQKLVDFTKLCSRKRCSGRGRCVHRGALDDSFADEIIRDTEEKLDDWVIDDRYMCRCNDGTVAKKCR